MKYVLMCIVAVTSLFSGLHEEGKAAYNKGDIEGGKRFIIQYSLK